MGGFNPLSYFMDKVAFFLALRVANTKYMKGLIAQSGSGFLPGHFSFSYIFKTVEINIIAVKHFGNVIVIIPMRIKNNVGRLDNF